MAVTLKPGYNELHFTDKAPLFSHHRGWGKSRTTTGDQVSVIEQILHMIHENPKYENLLDDFFVLHTKLRTATCYTGEVFMFSSAIRCYSVQYYKFFITKVLLFNATH